MVEEPKSQKAQKQMYSIVKKADQRGCYVSLLAAFKLALQNMDQV